MIRQLWQIELDVLGDDGEFTDTELCTAEFEAGYLVLEPESLQTVRIRIEDLQELLSNYDPNYHD